MCRSSSDVLSVWVKTHLTELLLRLGYSSECLLSTTFLMQFGRKGVELLYPLI